MNLKKILAGAVLAASMGTTTALVPAAQASEAGRRNTTYALGAATAGLLATHHYALGAATGVGTYYAYHNYQALINARHRRQQALERRHAYNLGYRVGSRSRTRYYSSHTRSYASHTRRHRRHSS